MGDPAVRRSEAEYEEPAVVARLRDGDESALVLLIDRYFAPLTAFVAAILGSRDAAQDVAQETFVRVWERRETIDPSRGIKALMYTLAKHAAFNDLKYRHVRKRHQDRLREDAARDPRVGSVPSQEDAILSAATVQTALARLSDRRQLAVRLRIEGQLGYDEIAAVLEVSPAAAERLVQRGMEELRRILRGSGVSG